MTALWSALFFFIGVAAGAYYMKRKTSDHRSHELEALLTDLQNRHENYQQDVRSHFDHSAQLANEMTQRYRDLHEHLRAGAQVLCDDPKRSRDDNPAHQFVGLAGHAPEPQAPNPYGNIESGDFSYYEPPRDYATKDPQDKGMLDERYGFK